MFDGMFGSGRVQENGRFKGAAHRLPDDEGVFDVLVAGAGPAGATAAYYLSKFSKGVYAGTDLRIGLLDKARFPRDKYCGDAWCAPALEILEDMGVLQELEAEGLVCDCLCGGFVSPAGHSYIANDRNVPSEGKNMSTRAYAIKRKICDERIARCAGAQPGVSLIEDAQVEKTEFFAGKGVWRVECADGRIFTCRFLVAADGAASNIARSLGLVTSPPSGVAARRYVKPGTHNFKADGVLLYPDYTLPGYAALFRHYDGSIDLGLYLLPGGVATDADLAEIYEKKLMTDPFVSRALGSKVEFSERLKVASLRLGGERTSYGDHIVLVGDAAGQVDPLTGEGIHTGQIGGKIAAETIAEMFRHGDFSKSSTIVYHRKWWAEFGADFPLSGAAGKILFKAPFLMDAVPRASDGKGGKAGGDFFKAFGAVMTGVLPKSTFLLPSIALPLAVETIKQFFAQHILKTERDYHSDPASLLETEIKRPTSWDAQCLIDPTVSAAKDAVGAADSAQEDAFRFADDTKEPALVLYGTEYGFSRDLALELCESLEAEGVYSPRCLSMEHCAQLVDWAQETTVFAVCSTAGDGVPPTCAVPFFDALRAAEISGLEHLSFSVLAPGDTAYPKFAQAGKDLRDLMLRAGASECVPIATLKTDDSEEAKPWVYKCAAWRSPAAVLVKGVREEDYLREKVRANSHLFQEEKGATRRAPYKARIKLKRLLTSEPSPGEKKGEYKETWHIELDISHGNGEEKIQYLPGDALGVQPTNADDQVMEILEAMQVSKTEPIASLRSAFEHLKLCDLKDSLGNLKTNPSEHVVDIVSRLSPEMDLAAKKNLLEKLKPLQPRYYSIASSPEADKGEIHLCVAAVRYSTLGRTRQGVASTFLIDRVPEGSSVNVWVQRNNGFRPAKSSIMIGPGTGIAPFRSFIRQPNALARDRISVLYFGCRNEDKDFLYAQELQDWGAQDNHELHLAFSRDGPVKDYVQHRLAASANSIWELLSRDTDAQIYICGEGFHMAGDVKNALYEIAIEKGGLKNPAEAVKFFEKRLHLDVWVS